MPINKEASDGIDIYSSEECGKVVQLLNSSPADNVFDT
jgi:hypothetical protein